MDKEALEKIYNDLRAIHEADWRDYVDAVIGVMEANGYRKLPKDKPPLLRGITIKRFWVEKSNPSENHWDLQGLLQAQREADIRHYEE